MQSRFHYGTTRLYVSMSALYLEHLHTLIAEMIDDLYRDAAGCLGTERVCTTRRRSFA